MSLTAHEPQQIGFFLKKNIDSFEKLSSVILNTSHLTKIFNFSKVAYKLTPFFVFTFPLKEHFFLPTHNIFSIEIPLFTKTVRAFFKKILPAQAIAHKSKFRGGRYFWIYRRKGYFWKKKKILRKRLLDVLNFEENSTFQFFIKMKCMTFLKSYWSFFKVKNKSRFKFGVHDISDTEEILSEIWEDEEVVDDSFFKAYPLLRSVYEASLRPSQSFYSKENLLPHVFNEISSVFFYKNVIFKKSCMFMFAKEMTYINARKQFTNYYIYKTFEFAYHEFWKKNEYPRLLRKYNFYKTDSSLQFEITVEDFEELVRFSKPNLDIFDEFFSKVFLFFSMKTIKKKKYKRRMGRIRRMKKKSIRYEKLDLLNFFLKKLSPTGITPSGSDLAGIYNSYFYNFFFLDITNFSEEIFEHQNYLNLLFKSNLNIHTQQDSLVSSNFLKKRFFESNYTPAMLLSDPIKAAILTQKRIITNTVDHTYLQHFITGFITHVTNFKSLFILNSNRNNFKTLAASAYTLGVYAITSYFIKIFKKFFKNFELPNFIEFFSFSLLKKDLNYFVKFFKKSLEEMSLKKHKKVLYSFEFLLKKFLTKFFLFTQVLGLKFEITGKISVTGNSKTRNKIIKYGYYSLTNKNLRIDYLYDTIRTTTGVLGFRMYLTY